MRPKPERSDCTRRTVSHRAANRRDAIQVLPLQHNTTSKHSISPEAHVTAAAACTRPKRRCAFRAVITPSPTTSDNADAVAHNPCQSSAWPCVTCTVKAAHARERKLKQVASRWPHSVMCSRADARLLSSPNPCSSGWRPGGHHQRSGRGTRPPPRPAAQTRRSAGAPAARR